MKDDQDAMASSKSESLQLIDGEFTPAEAATVILNLIDEKINFHKIRKLQLWEKDHTANSDKLNARIKALEAEKARALAFFEKATANKSSLKVDGAIKLTML